MPLYRRQVIKPTADLDAVAYIGKVGITNVDAQNAINDFVLGLKNLGLWSSILCWPLRSTQNAGTGATVYSLGGNQTSNATLTGASWTTDGVFFSGSTQYMISDVANLTKDATLFVSAKGNGSSYASFPYIGGVFHPTAYYVSSFSIGNANSGSNMIFGVGQPAGYLSTSNIANGLSGASSFVALSGSYKRNSVFNIRNLSASTIGTQASYLIDEATTLTKMVFNGRWSGSAGELGNPMTSSFFAIISPNCDSIISSFYSLYKSTIGAGLGLP
jgi:hypothetical protein